jgi:heparin/heparan-sulfate lyase
MNQFIYVSAFMMILTFAAEDRAKIPAVPSGHPRVYVRPEDLPDIRRKLEMPEFAEIWKAVRSSRHPLCRAFLYLITGDERAGREAIERWFRLLQGDWNNPDRLGRVFLNYMHVGACVYDWCYDLLTDEKKRKFIEAFKRIAASHSPGYPARENSPAVVGHITEGWLLTGQLPAGVAIYDEFKTMYEAAAKLFFERFIPVRNFLYPAHMHHQGDSYIVTRFIHDIAVSWLFRRMGAGDVFSPQQRFVPYQLIYHLRPDGKQMRSGDTFDERGDSPGKRMLMLLTGTYYDDPYLLWMADSGFFRSYGDIGGVFELLFRKPGSERRPISELPLTKYFPSPMGEMVARTGWNIGMESRDAVVYMRIGEYFFGNHQHKDFGTFQIYYRGPLAISTGVYDLYGSPHWRNYYHQTISKNGLLIFDPSERRKWDAANDGGQRWPKGTDHPRDLEMLLSPDYRMGKVTAHSLGPDPKTPDYSYIVGDITDAYSPHKVDLVARAMVTFNTRNPTYPCILVVFDRIISTEPSFKKSWLIHSIQEPKVEGRTITIIRDGEASRGGRYGGKLIVESLLPEKVEIIKVGGNGKEFWIESAGTNYTPTKIRRDAEPGSWRVEVSPASKAKADLFLHVLTVMDISAPDGPNVKKMETETMVGARVLNYVVFFARGNRLLREVRFTIEGEENVKTLICDLEPGMWDLSRNGEGIGQIRVTDEGKCAYLDAMPGDYLLSKKRKNTLTR